MIIIVGSNKGGSGKTTTATNLAVALTSKGSEVVLVDADPQRSAARWHQDREEAGHKPSITLLEKRDNISQSIRTLDEKFDYVIVDVAGRNSREMITGAAVADMIIAPHQASQLDLDTLAELQEQTIRIRDLNPELKVLIYHAMASTNPSVKETERKEFLEYVSQFAEFQPLESISFYRKAYKDVIPLGQSVMEYGNEQAINEINALINEVFE
ncbi:division plane positioning ATPase MipZ [Teredinibacter turnerae]|uniref:division plane positioning ATPase MipZ n=1 Tax=Teredinibacter turnerae TaxID=2426 RepID=UPI000368A49C|nr:division plane positioning ATPase MipZ [Teredinibacter turnerae]